MTDELIVFANGSKENSILFQNLRFNNIPVSYALRPFPALIFPIAGFLAPRGDPYLFCLTTIALSRGFDFFIQPIKRF